MNKRSIVKRSGFVLVLLWSMLSLADSITGTVRNQTTGRPAAGDDVILLRLGEGMQEQSRTKTDSLGSFTLATTAASAEYIVRVLHGGVNYDHVATGTAQLQIDVYDAVAKIPALAGSMGIVQTESDAKFLKVTEMYAINNDSRPPVTQANPRNLTISLPAGASLNAAEVKSAGGIWTKAPLAKGENSGKYNVDFPLRPGETLFKFSYHIPYNGPIGLHLRVPYPIQKFAVVHPTSMSFKAERPNTFKNPGMAGGLQIEQAVAEPLTGDVPPFVIAGQGLAPSRDASVATSSGANPATAAAADHAGLRSGSLPLQPQSAISLSSKQGWLIACGVALFLAVALFSLSALRKKRAAAPASRQPLLDALKEELFQLESERLRGSISDADYTSSKAALNLGIQRALSRNKN